MLSLLDPRIWLAAALAFGLAFGGGYFKGSQDRGHADDLERQAAVAAANSDARKLEQERQRRVDDAVRAAAASENRLRADAARARGDADGLRSELDVVQRAGANSIASSQQALRITSELFGTCVREYLGMAEDAARADGEARELRQAWPK